MRIGAGLALLAAGLVAVLALIGVSITRLITAGPPPPMAFLVGAPLLLAIGIGAIWIVGIPSRVGPSVGVIDWARHPVRGGSLTRGEVVGLGFVLLLFGAVVVRLIATSPALGFDESIYALTARWWVEGTPNTGWATHRSPGISVLGIVGLPFGTWELPYRLIGLSFGLAAVASCWRLARALAGPAAGMLAALVVVTIPDFQLNSAAFLTDVPSAALMIVLMLLVWRRFEPTSRRPRAGRGLLLLAPIAAATFYIRYGSSVPMLFVGIAIVVLWPRQVVRRWRQVAAATAMLGLLLLPHLVYATSLGSPWAIALSARGLAAPAYPGAAFDTYLGQFFTTVAAPIAGGLAVVGLIAAAARLLGGHRAYLTRVHLFLLIPALGSGLLLGVVALAQTRYIYLSLMLLVISGAVGLSQAWRRLPALPRAGSAILAFVVVTVTVLNVGSSLAAEQAARAQSGASIIDAASLIRADAEARTADARPRCAVLTYLVPEVTWYSGCAAFHFGYPAQAGRETLLSGPNRYLLLTTGSTVRQPSGAMLAAYLRLVEPQPVGVVRDRASGAIAVRVYRFRDAPAGSLP